jgi:hypothetical protein
VEYNLNLHNQRPKETDNYRDVPFSSTDKTMMHTGPTLFTEAIYDALWKCKDIDCGEYIVVSEFVFAYVPHARKNYCEAEEARLFY